MERKINGERNRDGNGERETNKQKSEGRRDTRINLVPLFLL